MKYRIFGVGLESDVPLPELHALPSARIAVRAFLRHREAPRPRGARWESTHAQGWMDVSRRPGEWRIRFARLAEFIVSDDAARVQTSAPAATPVKTIRHLLIDQVVPMMLSAQGHMILHGSAVSGRGGGVLLIGDSGAGKSTLAVSLMLAGWKLLSDDLVRIEAGRGGTRAIAAYAGARLWPDVVDILGRGQARSRLAHYTDKRRVFSGALAGRVSGAAALRRVYLLGTPRPEIAISPLPKREALIALLANVTRLDTGAGEAERDRLDTLTHLCQVIPVRRISYPRDLNRLEDVRRAIVADLSSDHVTSSSRTRK